MAKSVVGLDIGTTSIRGVQARANGRKIVLEKAFTEPIPAGIMLDGGIAEPTELTQVIKQAWKKHKIATKDVRLGVGGDRIITNLAELNWMKDKDFHQALPYLIEEKLMVEREKYTFDYHTLSESVTSEEDQEDEDIIHNVRRKFVLVAGVENEYTNVLMDITLAAGLRPISVDLNAFALIRSYTEQPEEFDYAPAAVDACVDIGGNIITVALHKNGQPVYVRTVSGIGGNTATLAIADRLGVNEEVAEKRKMEALTTFIEEEPDHSESVFSFDSVMDYDQEPGTEVLPEARRLRIEASQEVLAATDTAFMSFIRETLNDFTSDPSGIDLTSISGLSLSGGVMNAPGLIERITSELKLPAAIATPFAGHNVKTPADHDPTHDHLYATAAGLALGRGASHG